MPKSKTLEETPLLKEKRSNWKHPNQDWINFWNDSDLETIEGWIATVSRYDGKTKKSKKIDGNWKYKTDFESDQIIDENYEIINEQKYWARIIHFINAEVKLELLSFNKKNELSKIYKNYENFEKVYEDMNGKPIDLNSFKASDFSSKTIEDKFLEGTTIKTINNISNFIKNIKSFNEEIKLFKDNPNNNRDLNVLLKFYKYLTVIQNFIDISNSTIDLSTSLKFKRILFTIGNWTLGLIEIYIGLTGKNLQRVISNYPIDGKPHTTQDYIETIFLNWENYLMVFIDTALATFLTSAASSWSRDVIFNKKSKTNPCEIKEFNFEGIEKYKNIFELLLFEENHQELIKIFKKIIAVNDLMEKFNEIENSEEFEYHPNFSKEITSLELIISRIENNNLDDTTDIDIQQVITFANERFKQLIEKEKKKPLELVENWGRNLLVNLTLETLTWGASHVILTGSSENTSKESFNLQNWITKDIFTTGALVANVSRYFIMRPINNIFKSGLSKLHIPTNLCPEKLSKWVNKQSRTKKLLMAIPLFLSVTFTVNAVKTEAGLTTEYGIKKATELFYEKFFRLTTLGFSVGVTMIDMIAFAISDFYKDVFNQSISIKTLANILTRCCGFNEQETTFLEENLKKLEENGELPSFSKKLEEIQKKKSKDSGIDSCHIDIEEINSDYDDQPSTSTGIFHSNHSKSTIQKI